MARETRPGRPPSGPGRPTKRARTSPANEPPREDSASGHGTPRAASTDTHRGAKSGAKSAARWVPTGRAFVFLGVALVLLLSSVGSLRVWLIQANELAVAQRQIEERSAEVAQLQEELARWNDPAYVRAQARTRLGWVMPGEVGYRVIGTDGTVLSGTAEIEGVGASQSNDLEARWWDRLGVSVRSADETPTEPTTSGSGAVEPAPQTTP